MGSAGGSGTSTQKKVPVGGYPAQKDTAARSAGGRKANDEKAGEKQGSLDKEQQPRPSVSVARTKVDPAGESSLGSEVERPKPPMIRTDWDINFEHPYAGSLKFDGTGIYCRACPRWVPTVDFAHETFFAHVKRVHPKPPLGWTGEVP